jgi:hypothetical protein
LSPDLWVPGAAEPSLETFVQRLHDHVERFARDRAGGEASVEVELRDGSVLPLVSLLPEPGYGFVTLCPRHDDGDPEELVVPVGSIVRIRLTRKEDHVPFGFSSPKRR